MRVEQKNAIVFMAIAAMGLLSARVAVSAESPADRTTKVDTSWDEGGPADVAQLAYRGDDDSGPPPPPRGDNDRRPPPGARHRGPEADRHQPPGPPRDGDQDRRPPPLGGGRGPGAGGGMGPGTCPLGSSGPMGLRGGLGDPMNRGMRFGPMGSLENLEKIDPEMYKLLKEDIDLDRQSRELARQCRRAVGADRDKVKQQIEELVGKHFEVRQQLRALKLKRIESELQRLRETIDRRAKARKEIVDKRVAELVGREDELQF